MKFPWSPAGSLLALLIVMQTLAAGGVPRCLRGELSAEEALYGVHSFPPSGAVGSMQRWPRATRGARWLSSRNTMEHNGMPPAIGHYQPWIYAMVL